MGLFRLLILFFIGYFVVRFVKKLVAPSRQNPNVHGQSEQRNIYRNKNNIQDADYEELE